MPAIRSCCVVLALALPAAAQDVHKVPSEHPTIQEAVDVAADGDIVEISGGTYFEAVVVAGKTGLLIRAKGKVVIDPPGATGLTLDGCTDCVVEKVRVAGGAPYGFHLLDSTGCALVKCRVESSADDGIRAEGGSGHLIEKCTVEAAGDDAIALGSGGGASVDGSLVIKCKLIAPHEDGVFVNGSNNDVESCTAIDAGQAGFSVTDSASSNDFFDCKAVRPGTSGLFAAGSNNDFLACKVTRSTLAGAYVESGNANRIAGCKLVKSGFDGIFAEQATTNVQILDNKVVSSADDNIEVDGPGASVTDNICLKATDDGCRLDGTGGTWSRNTSKGSGGDGFFVAFGTGNTLDDNTAKGSKGDGFGLGPDSSGNTLTSNVGKGNKGFDLNDESGGANTIGAGNDFGTTSP